MLLVKEPNYDINDSTHGFMIYRLADHEPLQSLETRPSGWGLTMCGPSRQAREPASLAHDLWHAL